MEVVGSTETLKESQSLESCEPIIKSSLAAELLGKGGNESFLVRHNVHAKFLYFTLFCSFMGQAFFSIFFCDVLEFSATQIAVLLSVPSVLTMAVATAWTNYCDKTFRYRSCLALCSLASQLLICLMGVVRPQFFCALIFVVFISVFNAGLCPMLDGMILETVLGPRNQRAEYGKQRLWGAIGAGVMSPALGAAIRSSESLLTAFLIAAGAALVFVVSLAAPNAQRFKVRKKLEPKIQNEKPFLKAASQMMFSASSILVLPVISGELAEPTANSHSVTSEVLKSSASDTRVRSLSEIKLASLPDAEISASSESSLSNDASNGQLLERKPSQIKVLPDLDDGQIEIVKAAPENGGSITAFLISNKPALVFLLGCGLYGMSMSMIASFELLFMQSYLGASVFLLGWVSTFQVCFELPFFFWSENLLLRLGVAKMMLYAQLATLLRLCAYCLVYWTLSSPVIMLFIDLLHGLSFALWWSAAVYKVNQLMPSSMAATGQGLLSATYGGFGAVIGALLGGVLYQNFVPNVLWLSSMLLCAISIILQQKI